MESASFFAEHSSTMASVDDISKDESDHSPEEDSRLQHILSWISEDSVKYPETSPATAIYSCIENLKTLTSCSMKSARKKKDEENALLCLLAASPLLPDLDNLCEELLYLGTIGILEKKSLYLAFAARDTCDALLTLINLDRRFWSDEEALVSALMKQNCNPLMELLLLSVKKKCHWFPFILEVITSLLNKDCKGPVENLLSSTLLGQMWPVVLLHLIQKRSSLSALETSVKHCLQMEIADASVRELAEHLHWQLNVISALQEEGAVVCIPPEFYTHNLSTLSLIHKSCNLIHLEWEFIHELLLTGISDGRVAKWELSTFDAFWASLVCFQCVLASCQLNMKSMQYKKKVSDNFLKAQKILCGIDSLDIRIEVLEKIFSLLFLRFEDFQTDQSSDCESESGEDDENTSMLYMTSAAHVLTSSSWTSLFETDLKSKQRSSVSSGTGISEVQSDQLFVLRLYRKHGFVCERHVTRDLLKMLHYCICDMKKFFSGDLHATKDVIESPSEQTSFQSRISRIADFVSEALWRLEILTSADFVQNVGRENNSGGRYPSRLFRDQVPWYFQNEDSSSDDDSLGQPECGSQPYRPADRESHPTRRRSFSRANSKGMKDPIIKKMLANESSLIAQCLIRGYINSAKHIKEKMKQEDCPTPIIVELMFAEAYDNLKMKLNICNKECNKHPNFFQKSTLGVIHRAASAGVQASSQNNEVEILLTTSTLPVVPNVEHLPVDSLQLFGGPPHEQSIAVAGADVALMLSTSAQQALNFLSIASRYSQELRNIQMSALYRPHSMGFLPFIQSVFQAMGFLDSVSPSVLLHRWDIPSFTHRHLKNSLHFIDGMKKCMTELHSSQNLEELFPKLLKLMQSNAFIAGLENKQELSYLQELKAYLRTLAEVVKHQSNVVSGDGPLLEEHFALLKKNPYKLMSNMILIENISFEVVEVMASHLGGSLLAALCSELCSCFPSIPPARISTEIISTDRLYGTWVLNSSDNVGPARHPTDAVHQLLLVALTELQHQLKIERHISNSQNGRIPLSCIDAQRMLCLLSRSWELAFIDTTLLEAGAETLVFHCNLATLMWIHGLIFLHSIGDQNSQVLFRGSPFHQTAVLSSVSYHVGSLGTISLWEALRLALGADLMNPPGTEALCQYAVTIDSCDPFALFVIPTGSNFSPKIQMLCVENLEQQFQQSVQEYLSQWVHVNSNEIAVPSLIMRYIHYTGQNLKTFLLSHCNNNSDASVLLQLQLESLSEDATIAILDDFIAEEFFAIYDNKSSTKMFPKPTSEIVSLEKPASLNESLSTYMKQKCPVIGTLLQNLLHEAEGSENEPKDELEEAIEMNETALLIGYPSLDRLCKSSEIVSRSYFFEDNALLCALHNFVPDDVMWECLDLLVEGRRWEIIVDMLDALPELQIKGDHVLGVVQDLALMNLAVESRGIGEPWKYSERISSLVLRSKHTFVEAPHWPGHICLAQLQSILQIPELRNFRVLHEKATQLKQSIGLYHEILRFRDDDAYWKSWQDVKQVSCTDPQVVLDQILIHGNAQLCILWLKLHNISSLYVHLIDERVIALLLNAEPLIIREAEKVIGLLPHKVSSKVCLRALQAIHSISGLQLCIRFLNDICVEELSPKERDDVKLAAIGVGMVELLSEADQLECVELVTKPQLILEQLVMNMRLEAAERVLKETRSELERLGSQSPLSIHAVDSMLRQYADKALEFRVAQGSSTSNTGENSGLLSSFSSLTSSKDFLMPSSAPSKNDWIPNEKTSVCMNCQLTSFSMFSRRHHCRRCGRVVCGVCSAHRMNVEGYGTVKVRVCASCHSQSQLLKGTRATVIPPSSKSSTLTDNVWRLSLSSALNDTIRGEFGYENSPSVSLSLSILNLHSKSAACPSFLVDSCDVVLSYLQPRDGVVNPEIDYGLVIEMCRSLVIAAKVKCAHWGFVSDEPICDQRLCKIDLIGLLISHGYEGLIPPNTSSHELRRLQALLLEEEQWELALEVSRKGGLEQSVVWSSWGKGCLRAGRWEDARDKFAHALPSKGTATSPSLLQEIMKILESTSYSMDKEALQKAENLKSVSAGRAPAPARAILHTLASLKSISQGKLNKVCGAKGRLEPLVYSECCYYLRRYGSHAYYLRFLVHHADLKEALQHILTHSIEPLLFFEWVYMPCLKMGQITSLHSSMTTIDPSLCLWKPYLNGICAALERRSLLHTLYEVQQWSKDHIRAAMTCIRFFLQNACSYSDLYSNISHLMCAQSHLEAALAVSSVSGKASKSGSGSNSVSSLEVETAPVGIQLSSKELDHHLSTVWHQIEVTKFLKNCEVEGQPLKNVRQWLPHPLASLLDHGIPTLFGNTSERKILAILCITCGKNVEEGFGVAYRIIEGFNINAQEVYEVVAIVLHRSRRVPEISKFIECIASSGITNPSKVCDNILYTCISNAPENPDSIHLDIIIRKINDPIIKISAFIVSGQLKSAYLLAVKYHRLDDIERILEEADRCGQTAIKSICLKRLGRL